MLQTDEKALPRLLSLRAIARDVDEQGRAITRLQFQAEMRGPFIEVHRFWIEAKRRAAYDGIETFVDESHQFAR